QRGSLDHVDRIGYYQRQDCLVLDAVTVRNLELIEPIFAEDGNTATLFRALDATLTPMGKRLLRSWLLRPSIAVEEIDPRLDAVATLRADTIAREELRRSLDGIFDIERLLSRVTLEAANPRDLLALSASLGRIPAVRVALQKFVADPDTRLAQLHTALDDIPGLRVQIDATIVPEPPLTFAEGGVIASGRNAELDELRDLSRNSRQYIAQVEERERRRTGIASLKIKFNSIFGYYIEISKANLHLAPSDYERKQTLVNAERFTTPEIKEYEAKVLDAQEKIVELERRLFAELRSAVAAQAKPIRQTALALAQVDVLACFSHLAAARDYCRPVFDDAGEIEIISGRHPVVETQELGGNTRFVPNDLFLDSSSHSLLLLTGPNMGGKSTYLRQTALIVLMAQMGCFVPARSARLSVLDRIFTRIGASDNLARGRSTFMVEITETAAILNTATARSLILLDEIGRGTSTYDGLAIAWAVIEYLHSSTQAKTLFATHYHELTELAALLPGVKNFQVTVKDSPSGIVFLRKVEPGPASRSYGIEVAKLAGLPPALIERAREILKQHETAEQRLSLELAPATDRGSKVQLTMFTPLSQQAIERLKSAEVDKLTPLEALNLLAALKKQLD
ncbi:MAG TPA: DNA mismatch repair protein MutS, partial [Terriglobales bacterium]|nr:DNA mismatch repair protein MutS [Terriglobales bacterium]